MCFGEVESHDLTSGGWVGMFFPAFVVPLIDRPRPMGHEVEWACSSRTAGGRWGADEACLRARGGPMCRGFVDALDR